MKHGGYLDLGSSADTRVVNEFLSGVRAERSKARRETASIIAASILSAALFSKTQKRR